jgi:hypothetical protein
MTYRERARSIAGGIARRFIDTGAGVAVDCLAFTGELEEVLLAFARESVGDLISEEIERTCPPVPESERGDASGSVDRITSAFAARVPGAAG